MPMMSRPLSATGIAWNEKTQIAIDIHSATSVRKQPTLESFRFQEENEYEYEI